jgi:CubicO group peptidase (beta-lactamase class C family)
VFYHNSFGHHTYEKKRSVQNTDIYDLASITKIASTTLGLMRLYDLGFIDLDDSLGSYLPRSRSSNKEKLSLNEILTHQSGLQSWIPFYKKALEEQETAGGVFSEQRLDQFPIKLGEKRYLHHSYRDTLWKMIYHSELNERGEYVYSDLGFYLFHQLLEHQTQLPLDIYMYKSFYRPLGLSTMGYRPLERFSNNRVIPTEEDEAFRKQLANGTVHDPGAAMLEGVAGHAGLFSNANDLAILMQMLLNKGKYGGQYYFTPLTVNHFTAQQFPDNRKALGFDKPVIDTSKPSPVCLEASPKTFGHSGFTGTTVWADPEHELIYVFLSNRVHPDAQNKKLIKQDFRTRIQQVVYRALNNCLPAEDQENLK